ncbi:MAG: HAD hydrolase family protein [Oscillospiraceae bacterium]|nr:HAD hydrolase family protein [Oscillospiraceae bacterium]
MRRRLIFLDVDGTLTPAGTNTPPASALEAIRAARAAGHGVFLCSGRNRGMLLPVLGFGFDGAVASAGGYVFAGDELLFDCPMTEEQRSCAVRAFREGGVYLNVETRDDSFCDEGVAEFLAASAGGNSELLRWRRQLEKELGFRPMTEYDGTPVYKMLFSCARPEQLAQAREAMEGAFFFLVHDDPASGCVNGELINRKFDKGSGVKRIAAAFGVELADTVGFGDSMNDREMVRTVGTSVCMANGSPALKELSDLVCPAVEEDGLAIAFAELGLTSI